ncbi:dTDP-4-dehydrorhamnose reductase [Candidatus Poribacteria bacterium]|nr:dTDP-4-dehydrorhamnose reductase [Candidatus Poribacteria bacterium]
MKILITGANGQLGTEFRNILKNSDKYKVIAPVEKELDITDLNSILKIIESNKPDLLINCAAYNLVDNAENSYDSAYNVNALGVKNLSFASKKNNIKFIHYSSDYIFDGTKEDFYTEDDIPNPINKYGESKLQGEKLLMLENDNFLIFRTSWVFGKGKQNFLYKLMEWGKKNRVLKIVYDQISIPTYTEDIAKITMLAIEKELKGIYNLTNSGYASRYEVARYFFKKLKLNNLILPVSSDKFNLPAKRPFFSVLANKKISDELGITIPSWQDGIEKYIKIII